MSKIVLYNSYIEIEAKQVNVIFAFKNEKCEGLNEDKYQNAICKLFGSKFNTTVNVKGKYVGKAITIRLICAFKNCKTIYSLSIQKDKINVNENIQLKVTSSCDICNHDTNIVRHLMKDERIKVSGEIKSSTVSNIRNESIINADKDLLASGNLQAIHTSDVLRKVKSEETSKNDMSSHPLFDLFMKTNQLSSIFSVEYKENKFGITILSSNQMETFKTYLSTNDKENKISRIYYDATGKICASPTNNIKNIFNHVLVIPIKPSSNDKSCCLVNIGELITSLHTSDNQEIFLRRFCQMASKILKTEVIVEEVVSDFSWAAINAVSIAFNHIRTKIYLDICYEIITTNDTVKLKEITIIKLCSSHLSKNIRIDIRKCFETKMDKKYLRFISAAVGGLFNMTTHTAFDTLLKNIIILLIEEFQTKKLKEAINFIKLYADAIDDSDFCDNLSQSADGDAIHSDEFFSISNTIYKSSKFFQIYDAFIQNYSSEMQNHTKNRYYNPKFLSVFLKKYVAFMPMWTQILTAMRGKDAPRANNGYVEKYFASIKNDLRKEGHVLGKLKIGRYLSYIDKKIHADCLKVEYKIPSSNRRVQKESNIRFQDLNNSYENWGNLGNDGTRKKNKKSSNILFNKDNLKI